METINNLSKIAKEMASLSNKKYDFSEDIK